MFKQEIKEQVNKFNEYSEEGKMGVKIENGFATLYINDKIITEDFDFTVLDRIKQINRERGFSYL